ncbi:MAG: hypothetical protein AAB885_02145 [Patescibacteria group bacterium]
MSGPKQYSGQRFYCDHCGKNFRSGDMIAVWQNHTFCYPINTEHGAGNCINKWQRKHWQRLEELNIMISREKFDLMIFKCEENEEDGNYPAYI